MLISWGGKRTKQLAASVTTKYTTKVVDTQSAYSTLRPNIRSSRSSASGLYMNCTEAANSAGRKLAAARQRPPKDAGASTTTMVPHLVRVRVRARAEPEP